MFEYLTIEDLKEYMSSDDILELMGKLQLRNLEKKEEERKKKSEYMKAYRSKETKETKKPRESKQAETVEIIDAVKGKIEEYGMVYKADSKEYQYATNIRTGKAFSNTAEKYGLSNIELALKIIGASIQDKFRCGKVSNCKDVYMNYAKIINAYQVNKAKQVNSVGVLPGA